MTAETGTQTNPCQDLEALPGAGPWSNHHSAWWMDAPALDVAAVAGQMLARGARLATLSGVAREDGETDVIYHYVLGEQVFNLRARTRAQALPSITPILPAADWIEREIQDLFAVTFSGHPQPERLIRPAQLAAGFFRRPGGAASKPQDAKN